jgi:propanol-preferring alcohol dehydrogenase
MSRIPPLDYAALFDERRIVTVTANTRADGAALLAEAARIPLRPSVTTFPLERANDALSALKRGAFAGSGVLVM